MKLIPFDPKELEPVSFIPGPFPGVPPTPVFNTPISRKENFKLLISGQQPLWMPHAQEFNIVAPACNPDSWARGMVTTAEPVPPFRLGGADMFGVQWEFMPDIHGSMVRPGTPLVSDLENWEDSVVFPDIDAWDWAGSAAETLAMRSDGRIVMVPLMTGLFERLVSFVGMGEALIALVDPDMKPAVHRLFGRLCDLYDGLFAKMKEYLDADVVWFHDDWGSQRAPLFSPDTAHEMITPYLKRCVESAHKHGIVFEFHSCGQLEVMIPEMIEAGCDLWNGQELNDKLMLAKKYGRHLACDSFPEGLTPMASPEEKAAAVQKFMDDYAGLRIFVGMHFGAAPDEYRYVYEMSRKAYCGT